MSEIRGKGETVVHVDSREFRFSVLGGSAGACGHTRNNQEEGERLFEEFE